MDNTNKNIKRFMEGEEGFGTVEIVIIIAVLIGIAFIFKKQIYSLVDQIFGRIFNDAGETTNMDQVIPKELGN
ncbi:MAG: Flp1 family type IVb pilin [Eubacteriales bacterium]|nr:Flp1 family type IVb pilin [Eubacteriales bacterium]